MEKNLSRRERESLRHRKEILEAAKIIFFKNGYAASNMEAIASEAEFSLATVYKFFGSKENLFSEILLDLLEDIERGLDEISNREVSVRDRITAYFYFRIDSYWKNPAMIGLIEDVLRTNSGGIACFDDLKNRYMTFINSLTLLFSEGIATGEFADKGEGILASTFEGMLHMHFSRLNFRKITTRDRGDEANLLSIFMDGAATRDSS